MSEQWESIKGYEGHYIVSSFGRVFSIKSNLVLRQSIRRRYLSVSLSCRNRKKNMCIHRLVAEAFIGLIPEEMTVNHIDGDIKNNNKDNLEIITRTDNINHYHRRRARIGPQPVASGQYEIMFNYKTKCIYVGSCKSEEMANELYYLAYCVFYNQEPNLVFYNKKGRQYFKDKNENKNQ